MVKVPGVSRPTGTVKVTSGKKSVVVKLTAARKGKVAAGMSVLSKGVNNVTVTFTPSGTTKKFAKSGSSKILVKK